MARIILVVGDPETGQLIADAMFEAGHALGMIEDGAAALELMRARPPHLAIIDCATPGLSGVELVRAMRGDGRLCHVPVLMLTACHSQADEAVAFSAGVDDYLQKPADLYQLVGRVDALLSRASQARVA